MKNLEKLSSKLLSQDELSKIKGGGVAQVDCEVYWYQCEALTQCAGLDEFYQCVLDLADGQCSPLVGWPHVCNNS